MHLKMNEIGEKGGEAYLFFAGRGKYAEIPLDALIEGVGEYDGGNFDEYVQIFVFALL